MDVDLEADLEVEGDVDEVEARLAILCKPLPLPTLSSTS
jgi:hypothetical protein